MKVSIDRFNLSLGGTSMVDLVLELDVLEKSELRLGGLSDFMILRARASVVCAISWCTDRHLASSSRSAVG